MTRKRGRTTVRVPGVRVADDLVRRGFRPVDPNVLWVADITYLSTWEGWLYLAAVQDAFSRTIVGWSMGSKGDCFDNAVAESLFATLKKELVYREGPWPTRAALTSAIFEWIEVFYNRERRHSTLGYLSPEQFEQESLNQKMKEEESTQSSVSGEAGHSSSIDLLPWKESLYPPYPPPLGTTRLWGRNNSGWVGTRSERVGTTTEA